MCIMCIHTYVQTLIIVNFILVISFSFSVMTAHHARITACHFDRIIPLSLPCLPIPTGLVMQAIDPSLFCPDVFKICVHEYQQFSVCASYTW